MAVDGASIEEEGENRLATGVILTRVGVINAGSLNRKLILQREMVLL